MPLFHCGIEVASHLRYCTVCGEDIGFPNVRLAQSPAEQEALAKRLKVAETIADAGGYRSVLENFGTAVAGSKAVMARSLGDVEKLVKSENALLISYHKQVRAQSKLPQNNVWDRGRTAAESTILPNIYDEINFAALSLDGKGHPAYGRYFIVFKEPAIANRATIFEENPFIFCQRHRIVAGNAAPVGFRAMWADRAKLAKAKLRAQLNATTLPEEYPGILLRPGTGTADGDFVEVHIFGPIHRRAIERVIGPRPKHAVDIILWKSLDRELTAIGAQLEAL